MRILYLLKGFVFVLSSLISTLGLSQENNNYLFLKYGLQAQEKGLHYEACSYFVNAAKVDPTNIEVNYHYALSLNEINEYRMAEYYYQRTFDLDTEGKYPGAMVGLALTQKSNGKYKESLGNWEIVLEYAELTRNKELATRAEIEIATCKDILAFNYPYYDNTIRNLSEINSEGADFSGTYYDTTTIFYSSIEGLKAVPSKSDNRAPRVGQIAVAEKYNGKWEYGRKIPSSINVGGINNIDFCINPQRNKYYFVRCEQDSACGIFTGRMERGFPARPAPVKTINEAGGINTMPCAAIVNDQPVLVFASDREGGYGGLDLWYASITGVGTTSEPVNLGPLVNTPGDEVTPFIDSREEVLYFSSDWHPGFGGFDVFRCKFQSLDTLEKPVNIGFPFNSSANDTYFTLAPERTKGMITSNRVGSSSSMSETCCNDLYEFTFPPAPGVNPKKVELEEKEEESIDPIVIDKFAKLGKKLPIILYFHNDEPDPKSTTTKTGLTYRDCYLSYVGQQPEYKYKNVEDVDKIFGGLVEPGFKQLEGFLRELYDVAESGLEVELEIRGYASPLAKDDYNTNLTQRRISSFINYLLTIREGAFKPYVQTPKNPTGNLKILLSPLGESTAQKGISDDPNQPVQSVYSLMAAKERRIEITRLNLPIISGSIRGNSAVYGAEFRVEEEKPAPAAKPVSAPKVQPQKQKPAAENFNDVPKIEASKPQEPQVLENGVFDMGTVTEGEILKGTYTYTNTTNETIQFYKAEAECGCTGVKLSKTAIAPGESTEVYISFDSKGKSGVNTKSVSLFVQGKSEPIKIEFLATVM